MKRLLIWILIVVVLVVSVDIAIGVFTRDYLANHDLPGDYEAVDYLIKDSTDELLILGSSVALNSINTRKLGDSIKVRAYNAGANGQTFPYYLSMMEIAMRNPSLKTVILGFTESNMSETGIGSRFIFLVPYYQRGFDGIDQRLENAGPWNSIMLKSALYRYNTIWFRILLYHFINPGIKGDCGFVAKDIPAYFPERIEGVSDMAPSFERMAEFDQFVRMCVDGGKRLIVVVPPCFLKHSGATDVETYLRQRSESGEFELWFDVHDTSLSKDSTLFYDNWHLNINGANVYTDTIIKRMKI